jgi:hypothetical protein
MAVSSKTPTARSATMRSMTSTLTAIPNVGPAIARKLERLDVAGLDDLRGRDPEELFERLCALDGRRHDPCLLDTFVAAVAYADGGPARPWWEYSRERKARAHG